MKTPWVVAVAGLLLGGCAAGNQPLPTSGPEAGLRRVPYRLELRFASRVGDPYRILSGPAETYREVHFNERVRSRLERYVAAKSDPDSRQTATLAVTLESLDTTYDQIGRVTAPNRTRVASAGPIARVVPASYGRRSILGASEEMLEPDHDTGLPQEITKGARLAFTVAVRAGTEPAPAEARMAEVSHTWERDLDAPVWAYDYDGVFSAVIERLVTEVDAAVDRTLPPR